MQQSNKIYISLWTSGKYTFLNKTPENICSSFEEKYIKNSSIS